ASDEAIRQVVRKGKAIAHPELGHAVHVEIAGLEPAREYFYRFTAGGEQSAIGRAKTLSGAGTTIDELRFAAAGCQKYEDGHFTAWRHIAAERLDFVFHYGDYIYEYNTPPSRTIPPIVRTLPGVSGESYTLDEYRQRYAAYKLDPDLQAAHASAPFVVSFDDHEVRNNWAGDFAARRTPPELFLLRRAAAFQAWYEHMPLRRAQLPRGPDILAYRRIVAGDLLAMNVLDTRQYRSRQPCGSGRKPACPEALEPARTMLGDAQERWLYAGFRDPHPRWTLLAQQVPLMQRDFDPDPAVYAMEMDKWSGAIAARERLLAAAKDARLGNLVVVTGDVHHNCVGELKEDFSDPGSATLGTEFVGTSITSGGDGSDTTERFQALLEQDPHIRFYNNQRGYVRHVVTPERWQADLRVLDKVSVPDGRISTRRSFVIEHGRPGLADA
ncbi:MAG: alkaline phosphatase, partial [Betaproteobacteria bacterium]